VWRGVDTGCGEPKTTRGVFADNFCASIRPHKDAELSTDFSTSVQNVPRRGDKASPPSGWRIEVGDWDAVKWVLAMATENANVNALL
jgi:hypothetical protein